MSWHIHSLNLKCSWIYDNIWLYEWTPSSCRSLNFFHVNFSFRQSNITSFSASFKRLLFFEEYKITKLFGSLLWKWRMKNAPRTSYNFETIQFIRLTTELWPLTSLSPRQGLHDKHMMLIRCQKFSCQTIVATVSFLYRTFLKSFFFLGEKCPSSSLGEVSPHEIDAFSKFNWVLTLMR